MMTSRYNPDFILEFTFQERRRDAVHLVEINHTGKNPRREALRHYKPVKATMTITLEDE